MSPPPAFEKGSTPKIIATATVRSAIPGRELDRAASIVIRVTGPRSTELRRSLPIPASKRCETPRACTYYTSPFEPLYVELPQHDEVGRYQVSVTSSWGLEVAVEPTVFTIAPRPAVAVADLPRRNLGYAPEAGGGAIAVTPRGMLIAGDTGTAISVNPPDPPRPRTLDGRDPAIAAAPIGWAIGYVTPLDQPRASLFEYGLDSAKSIPLGPKHSYASGGASLRLAWQRPGSRWIAVWLSTEPLSQTELVRRARRDEPVPDAVTVARFVTIDPQGTAGRSAVIAESAGLSNLVATGNHHAILLETGPDADHELLLAEIEGDRLTQRTGFWYDRPCWATVLARRLAWDGTNYVAVLHERASDAAQEGTQPTLSDDHPASSWFSVVRMNPSEHPRVTRIYDPEREFGPMDLAFFEGQLWLVFASTEKHSQQPTQVVALTLGDDLLPARAIVLDDGDDRVRKVATFVDGGALWTAIFRDQQTFVVELPSAEALRSLPKLPVSTLRAPVACRLPDSDSAWDRYPMASRTPYRPPPPPLFDLQLQLSGALGYAVVRRRLTELAARCLDYLPRQIQGPIAVSFVVAPRGSVLDIAVTGIESETSKCLSGALHDAHFPHADSLTKVSAEWSR